jgi:peptidoglycan/LPS O-acetylase OafA/YrhL
MRRPRRPLFLDRAPYRRRRLRDAARLLPVLGLFLLLLPLFWTPKSGVALSANDVIYFFLVWLCLILLAAAFAPGLSKSEGANEDDD